MEGARWAWAIFPLVHPTHARPLDTGASARTGSAHQHDSAANPQTPSPSPAPRHTLCFRSTMSMKATP